MTPETLKLNYKYRCPEKDKYADDCKLAKDLVNEIIPSFTRSKDWINEYNNDLASYKLYNNDISQEDFEQVCNPLGIDIGQYDEEVLPYNKTYTKIDVLLGEEYKRGTNFILALMNSKALEEKDEELKNLYLEYIKEITEKNERIIEAQLQGLEESEIQKIRDEVIQSKTPEDIEKTSYMSELEILGNHILNYGMYMEDVRSLKNDCFKHALLSDKEFVYVGVHKGEPKIKMINPLSHFYSKTPDIRYVQDGDYAGTIEIMSIEKIIETYGHTLCKEDLERLQKRIPGLTGKYTGQLEVNLDNTLTNQYLHNISNYQYLGKNIGNYSDDIDANRRLLHESYGTVVHVEWKWLREIAFLTTINDYGDEDIDIVDSSMEIPEYATEVNFINKFGEKSKKWEWVDERDNTITFEKMWIPRVWEATRIEGDIFSDVREKPFQPYSIERPFDVELGYYGCIYNSMNAKPISLMARMKPFQFMFFVVLHQIKELIPKAIGPIQNFDTSMIDTNLAEDVTSVDAFSEALSKTFYYRQKGINIYNSMINNIGGQATPTNISRPQPGSVQNMNVGTDLNNLLQLLGWLDVQIGLACGVSPQREAQFSSNTNVTDNQQAIVQSSHITEHYFRKHNDLWKKVMEAYINYAKIAWKNKKIKRQYLMSDLTVQVLDIQDTQKLLNADIGLFVTDSGKEFEYINQMAEMTKIMAQNGASTETVSYILKARAQGTSPEEIHKMITKLQLDSEKRQQANIQAEQENQKLIEQMKIEAEGRKFAHEVNLENIKGEYTLEKANIDASRFQRAADSDDDGEPDIVEVAKLKLEENKHTSELDIKNKELDIKRKELELKNKEIDANVNLKNKDIDTKAATAKYVANKRPTPKK